MALKESFETYDGTGFTANGTTWRFQTFTTTSEYSITAVALYGWRFNSCGTVTVSIRAVDGSNKPTGADLASGTITQGSISALPSLTWVTCTFSVPYALSDATEYAIVWRAPSGDGSNYYAPFGYGSSGYAGGGSGTSTNSGSSWGAVSGTNDANFRVYSGVPSKPINPIPVDTGTDIDFSNMTLSWDDGGGADTYDVYVGDASDNLTLISSDQVRVFIVLIGTRRDLFTDTCYWRIDAINDDGTTTGDVWWFTVAAPGLAQNPTPTDDQEDIKITGTEKLKTLYWEAPI